MNRTLKKILVWGFISLITLITFWWLFSLGIPEAALEFALGTTVIIVAGLFSGNFAIKLWQHSATINSNKILLLLSFLTLLALVLIGFLVNEMIRETQFNHFLFTVITLFLVCGFVAAIISLVRIRIKFKIKSAQTEMVKSKTELHFLQSQISPHFLFNTLNNIYGLSITEHQKVPVLLLKLSELLRYSLYEAKDLFVSLSQEVNYLQNYIEFEQIRLGSRLELKSTFPERIDQSIKIAPMLLIVFVENAFKHSKNSNDEKIYIGISLGIKDNTIIFSCVNSYSAKEGNSGSKKMDSGLGLESVKKRLSLLYKDKYVLEIETGERDYNVNLKLKYNEIEESYSR